MGTVLSRWGTRAALSWLQSARECEGQLLKVAVGETEQKTAELCTGQAGDGGLAAGSAELLSLSLSLCGCWAPTACCQLEACT